MRRVVLHALRHTMATLLLHETRDLKLVAARLGHADETLVPRTYGHPLRGWIEPPQTVSGRYDLRHTAASHLLARGVHPKVVQERLGHSTIALTLDTYSHVLPALHADAVPGHREALFGADGSQGGSQPLPGRG